MVEYGGSKSVHAQLTKRISTTDPSQLNLLDANAASILDDLLQEVVKLIHTIDSCLADLPLKDVSKKRDEFDAIIRDAETYATPAQELLDGIKCLVNDVKSEKKEEEANTKYQVGKFIRVLVTGGASKHLAKRVGRHWLAHLLAEGELAQPSFLKTGIDTADPDSICVFSPAAATDDPSKVPKLVNTLKALINNLGAGVKDKQQTIAKTMDKKNFKTATSKFEVTINPPPPQAPASSTRAAHG